MKVFKYEVKQHWKGILGWGIGLAAVVLIYMPFLGVFLDEAEGLKYFFESMSIDIYAAMGLNPEFFFGSLGFYGFIFTFIYVIVAVQGLGLGLRIITKETEMKTADFLLTKPKTRTAIFLQKALAVLACLGATQAVFCASSAAIMHVTVGGLVNGKMFWLITVSGFFVQVFCGALGLLLGVLFPRIKAVTQVAVGLSMGLFMLTVISNITGKETLRPLAVFKYFDCNYILTYAKYETKYFVLCLALTALFFLAALFFYRKKDIDAV